MSGFIVTLGGVRSAGARGRRRCACSSPAGGTGGEQLVQFREEYADLKTITVDTATIKLIREKIVKIKDDVKLIVEVRDPRVPKTSESSLFHLWRRELKAESMVVYTKAEMVSERDKDRIRAFTMDQMDIPYEQVFFEDLRQVRRLRTPDRAELVSKMKRLALARGSPPKKHSYKVMVAGVPNSGKSSVVYVATRTLTKNRKRRGLYCLPPVGFQVGVTKDIGQNWLNLNPDVILLDMPGVITKSHSGAEDPEAPYKLAVVQCVSLTKLREEAGITVRDIADYLLFKLNQAGQLLYTRTYEMLLPTDDVNKLLEHVPGGNEELKCLRFVRDFQRNRLGFLILDDIPDISTERPDEEGVDQFLKDVERKFQEAKRKTRFEMQRQRRLTMWKDDPEDMEVMRRIEPDGGAGPFNF